MMARLGKPAGLILGLLGVICLLIVLPAWQLGVAGNWRIILLAIGYFSFFLGTVWRVIRYGDLAARSDDLQVRETIGRVASLVTIFGLIGLHWLAIYTFATSANNNDPLADSALPTLRERAIVSLGIWLILGAIVLSQTAIRTLGKFFDRLTIKTDHQLVTEGVYSTIRHPIYTSYILLFLGFCAVLQSLWGLALLIITCAIWFGNRIGIEERMLADRFGDRYQEYCQHTKRLFPYLY